MHSCWKACASASNASSPTGASPWHFRRATARAPDGRGGGGGGRSEQPRWQRAGESTLTRGAGGHEAPEPVAAPRGIARAHGRPTQASRTLSGTLTGNPAQRHHRHARSHGAVPQLRAAGRIRRPFALRAAAAAVADQRRHASLRSAAARTRGRGRERGCAHRAAGAGRRPGQQGRAPIATCSPT